MYIQEPDEALEDLRLDSPVTEAEYQARLLCGLGAVLFLLILSIAGAYITNALQVGVVR